MLKYYLPCLQQFFQLGNYRYDRNKYEFSRVSELILFYQHGVVICQPAKIGSEAAAAEAEVEAAAAAVAVSYDDWC